MTSVDLRQGDCLAVLRDLPDNSVDAVVTDPPYGLSNTKPAQVADVLKAWVTGDTEAVPAKRGGFMGKDWDSFVPPPAVWEECMRVLKPGGHMAVFSGARTQDLMGLSIRLAGFEIREGMGWIFGSGFPKSHNISKAIDKAAGAEREVVGRRVRLGDSTDYPTRGDSMFAGSETGNVTAPATSEAARWDGWGTALKPAIEPIILARKPLDGTVANNVLAHGVGGLNIDASRVPTDEDTGRAQGTDIKGGNYVHGTKKSDYVSQSHSQGRFPANVLLDEHAAAEMDKQSGKAGAHGVGRGERTDAGVTGWSSDNRETNYNDSGGASRFFPVFKYQAKAPKRERPVIEREDGTKVQHPTVKPVALMEWLVTLITPPGGTVLDPFAGSGTTLQAARNKNFNAIGIEREPDYCELIHHRLDTTTLT